MRFFGPVLFYDLVRSARRARVFINRVGYVVLLLVVLWMMYAGMRPDYAARTVSPDQAARMAESFFAALKNERVYRTQYPTREHAYRDIVRYIEFWYNSKRRHSGLQYRTPQEVHDEFLEQQIAA